MKNITLTTPENNLLNKLTTEYGVLISNTNQTVHNQFSGTEFNVTPLSAALVRFLQISYVNYAMFGKMMFNSKPVAIGTYDRAKYLLLKIDRETYYNVID